MKTLAILSIICLLGPAFSAGAVEAVQRKHTSTRAQKTHLTRPELTRPERPAVRLSVPADSYRA
jgi:hypothetical protein